MNNASVPPDVAAALGRGDVEETLETLRDAVREAPDDAALRAAYGFLLWRAYRFDEGREQFERLSSSPDFDLATAKSIAKCHFQIGRFDVAAAVMEQAVGRCRAPDADSLAQLAACFERDGQVERAREFADQALRLAPNWAPATRLLAHLDKRQGESRRAMDRLQNYLSACDRPSDGAWNWGIRYELAACLDRVGDFAAAWRQLELAKDQLSPLSTPHLQTSRRVRQRQWELACEITDHDLASWHRPTSPLRSRLRIALLAGFPRSGTTLLEQMLASRPECVDTDETGILASQFVAPIVWEAPTAFDAMLEIRGLQPSQLDAGRDAFFRFTEAFLSESIGDRLLIEKEPLLTPDLALALRLFPEARLLMPLRDPRDVAISFFFTMVPLNVSSAAATTIEETCKFYADCMRHWLLLRDRLPWPWLETHYESLIAEPEQETRRLAEFLKIPWDASMVDADKRAERRAIRTPTYDDVTKPLYTRSIGRWKSYATQLEPAMRVLEPFLEAFQA